MKERRMNLIDNGYKLNMSDDEDESFIEDVIERKIKVNYCKSHNKDVKNDFNFKQVYNES